MENFLPTRTHRRSFLFTSGIALFAGCFRGSNSVWAGEEAGEESKTVDNDPKPGSHTLYLIKFVEGKPVPWESIQEKKLPQMIYVGSSFRFAAVSNPNAFSYAVWATKEQAEVWAGIDGVELIRKKEAKDVVSSGTAGDGDLYVELLINGKSMEQQAAKGSYKLAAKIVEEWQKLAAGKASVSLVKPTKPSPNSAMEQLIRGGQLKISSPNGEIPATLINAIKDHPQVFRMQWTKPFTTMHCPGCGMG